MKDGLLGGLMVSATGTFEPGHPWRGNPKFQIKYDPNEARKLMTEAGFSKDKKLKVKTQTSASGSGQMLPVPMNEFVQQSLAECFFDVELDVIEWNTLFTNWRKGAKDESARGAHATNVTYAAMDPFFAMIRFLNSKLAPPVSSGKRSAWRRTGPWLRRSHWWRAGRGRLVPGALSPIGEQCVPLDGVKLDVEEEEARLCCTNSFIGTGSISPEPEAEGLRLHLSTFCPSRTPRPWGGGGGWGRA